jgi:hypothetical protein
VTGWEKPFSVQTEAFIAHEARLARKEASIANQALCVGGSRRVLALARKPFDSKRAASKALIEVPSSSAIAPESCAEQSRPA